VHACLSVRQSQKSTFRNFDKFSIHAKCRHSSVVLGRQWNARCTSGSVDDVIFPDTAARGVGSIDMGAALQQVVVNF